MVMVKPKGDDD